VNKNTYIIFVFFFECTAIVLLNRIIQKITHYISEVFARRMCCQASLVDHVTLRD